MKNYLFRKIINTIEKYQMISPGEKILLAVSGGVDSMVLMHSFHSLRERLGIALCVAHLNHKLRGSESERDASFVKHKALILGLPVFVEERSVKEYQAKEKLSLEEAARRVRYQFLSDISRRENCQKIALAHSASDQAETILMKLMRGAGLKGLSGISPVRGLFIRPLIHLEREIIEKFLFEEGIEYCQDSTNQDTRLMRNRVRLELIPLLKHRFNPQVIKHLNQLAEISRGYDRYFDAVVKEKLSQIALFDEDIIRILLNKYSMIDDVLKSKLLIKALQLLEKHGKEISYSHIKLITDLAEKSGSGKVAVLPSGIVIKKLPGELRLMKSTKGENYQRLDHEKTVIRVPGQTDYPKFKLHISCRIQEISDIERFDFPKETTQACFDFSQIYEPLELRTMDPGDRFQPLGMKGTKKLHDFFIDEKIPREERRQIPLVVDKKGIIWVIGQRISDRCRLTERTRKVLIVKAN